MGLRYARLSAVVAICAVWLVAREAAAQSPKQTSLLLPPGVAASAAHKWALLVGINRYDHPEKISSLNYARDDSKLLYQCLVDPKVGAFAPENVFLMTDEMQGDDRPTNDNIAARLWALGQRVKPGDTFVFYFSGHGIVQDGTSYLLTVNTNTDNPASLAASSLRVADLHSFLGKIPAGQLLLILDACRNDPFSGSRATGSNPLKPEFVNSVVVHARPPETEGTSVAATFFGCSEGERSWEWPEHQQGVFTYYLVQGLRGAAADPKTGEVTLSGLEEYVGDQVRKWSDRQAGEDRRQTPWLLKDGPAGRVVLAVIVVIEPPAQAPLPAKPTRPVPLATQSSLRVSSSPAGAQVFVDGSPVGTSPCKVDFDLGETRQRSIEVVLKKEGYRTKGATVTLRRGEEASWEQVRLEAIAPEPERRPAPEMKPAEPLPAPATAPRVRRPGDPPQNADRGEAWTSPGDGAQMVYVPAGEFTMGSSGSDLKALANEQPQRKVYLNAFWIDKTEVSVGRYRKFCQATGRSMPSLPSWGTKDDSPVVSVNWADAGAYAKWAGKRLPTEAEWEKAARGTDGRRYPWGDEWDSKLCNGNGGDDGFSDTGPVGSLPGGASPYGCLNMAGNVAEWCSDWYGQDYYQVGEVRNPVGPTSGQWRVVRGGSYVLDSDALRVARRGFNDPSYETLSTGFRCVRDP